MGKSARQLQYRLCIAFLCTVLAACSSQPQLGRIEQGVYHQPKGWFSCPLPQGQLGFAETVLIDDAYSQQETKKRYNHETRRYEAIPVGPAQWLPSNKILFNAAQTPHVQIEWLVGAIPDTGDKGGASEILYGRQKQVGQSLLLKLDQEISLSGYRATAWLAQVPFLPANFDYGEISKGDGYVLADDNVPRIHFYLNLVRDQHFIWVTAKQPVERVFKLSTDWRDLERVYNDLLSKPQRLNRLLQTYLAYFQRCQFTTPLNNDYE